MENGFEINKRAERSTRKAIPKTKTDYLIRLILLQSVLCFLTVAGVLIASKVSPSAAERLKADYAKISQENMGFEDFRESAEAVFNSVEIVESEVAVPAAACGTGEDFYSVTDETGETVAVGEIVFDGTGGGDGASGKNTFAAYKISAEPVEPVKGARLTSPFGYRTNPISGNYGFHTGIDLAAAENTPVSAAFAGTVTETGESDVWGKYVLVRHSDSLETYYCHLNEIYVEQGAVIRSGETVGLLGSTGWSTGPHLHFEVRIDGVRVDPEKLLYPENGNEN